MAVESALIETKVRSVFYNVEDTAEVAIYYSDASNPKEVEIRVKMTGGYFVATLSMKKAMKIAEMIRLFKIVNRRQRQEASKIKRRAEARLGVARRGGARHGKAR